MKLNQLYPNDILSSPDQGIQELMRGFLVRTNFVPGVRHVIGWRGLAESYTSVEGWTAKIKGRAGVFGMYFSGTEKAAGWINGRFALCYFPDPGEELVEHCSLQAGAYTQKQDYSLNIRDFLKYPQLCRLFNIGVIHLGINMADHATDALILGMESISHQRLIAQDGVSLPREGRVVEIVKPGGYDQNFPSYDTAMAFYQVLAASITFNLENPPAYVRQLHRPGKEIVYDAAGRHWDISSGASRDKLLFLGYGDAGCKTIIEHRVNQAGPFDHDVAWERGLPAISEVKDSLWWTAHQISDFKTLDKKALGIDDRPQLIVLTGFLGSGKTSFLQHFIEYQVQLNRFVAIIQNEIGEIGLDGKLLDHNYAVTEIDEGCVCCTLVGNLKKAIHQILSRFHPDVIVLETTGVANPYNLLDEISEVEELVRFDSITTLVDGLNVCESIEAVEVAKEQIKAADILLLNKKDLLTDVQLENSYRMVKALNPTAPILPVSHGDINPALLYGVDPQDEPPAATKKESQENARQIHYSHQHNMLSSHKFSFSTPLDKASFVEAIKTIPRGVFRVKGVIDFTDSDKPLLFQYVGGRYEFSEFNNPNMPERFLVLIGQDLKKGAELIDWSKGFGCTEPPPSLAN
ncbi:MAG: GTP-binding protein [Desulfobacteraceae bacterium]|jgi:G3E family GTPase|nr:GTP-binding protein [Desulfobacteraceae bacterium]